MKFHTDSFFSFGQKHIVAGKPCQDYASSGEDEEKKLAFAIVSDGCSTGRNTDVGSRLLVLITIKTIREYWEYLGGVFEDMSSKVLLHRKKVIKGIKELLGITHEDMLATSIFACCSQTSGFVYVQGDGVTAMKYKDGSINMTRFEWPQNMPFYPAYEDNGLDAFIVAHGGDEKANTVSADNWFMDTKGEFTKTDDTMYSLEAGIHGIKLPIAINEDIEFIAIFSDGVTQIDNVDWKKAVEEFLNFKSTAGEFAKRRMIAGIKQAMKVGKGPFDDMSYAIIHVTDEETLKGKSK